jgi:pimeloyl-ACP methyl ester carboxylesterase
MEFDREIRFAGSSDGVKLAMALYGAGPPLVKAATWLTHIELDLTGPFDRQLIGLFSPHFRYVTYDARGCGLSQRKVDEISFDAWIRDLEAVVDSLGIDRFDLLGASQGAAVAVAYAARHPERVSRLILMGGFATSYFTSGKVDATVIQEADTLLKLVELGWGSGSPAFRQVFASKFMPDATTEQRRAFDDRQKATASTVVAVRYLRAMFEVDVRTLAPQVHCPTLSLHVKGDQMIYFGQGRRLAALIPGARFVPLEGNNHVPFADEPAWTAFVREVNAFLGLESANAAAGSDRVALTARQLEVLRAVALGHTDKQIARDLSLSPRTVEMHVASAMRALGARTRAEAVHKAAEMGQLR